MSIPYQPGSIIASCYSIQTLLGRGGMGITYAAKALATHEPVALKIVSLADLNNWKSVELLEREAQVLTQLDHPAIPSYINYLTVEQDRELHFCLVQKLAPGKSLATLVEEGWRTSEKEIKVIAKQVLTILTYLHQLEPPVIHRDLKPENLICSEEGDIYLVDFGAVRQQYQNEVTQSATVVGTFGYMAPEQFQGRALPATDLYGLGATLLYLLTHRSPLDLPHDTLRINFRSRVKVSPAFAAWLEQLLDPNLASRFSTATEALAALERTPFLNTKGWLKLGVSAAMVTAITLFGFHYRWFWLSRLGYYPTVCREGVLTTYFQQGGSLKTLNTHRSSVLWCDVKYNETPLHGAALFNDLDLIKRLLKAGTNPNSQEGDYNNTPLYRATQGRSLQAINLLLAAGANPNLKNKGGLTPLHHACSWGQIKVVEVLLEAGANPNVQDNQGLTPLQTPLEPSFLEDKKKIEHREQIQQLLKRHGAQ